MTLSSLRCAYLLCLDDSKNLSDFCFVFNVLNSWKTVFKQVLKASIELPLEVWTISSKTFNCKEQCCCKLQTPSNWMSKPALTIFCLIHNGLISAVEYLLNISVALRLWFCDVMCLVVTVAYSSSCHALSLSSTAHFMPSLMPPCALCCKLWQHNYFNIHSDQEMENGRRN